MSRPRWKEKQPFAIVRPLSVAMELAKENALANQAVYDAWEQDEHGEDLDYGCGGICDDVASAIVDVLSADGVEATTVHDESENHTYVMAKFPDGIYSVDIPAGVYETGTFYNYRKRPDVEFEASDVVWDRVFGQDELWRWEQIVEGM